MSEWLLIAFIAFQVAFAFWFIRLTDRRAAQMQVMLDEHRRLNDEFSEAIRLVEYGAMDEAVDMARRWHERVET